MIIIIYKFINKLNNKIFYSLIINIKNILKFIKFNIFNYLSFIKKYFFCLIILITINLILKFQFYINFLEKKLFSIKKFN